MSMKVYKYKGSTETHLANYGLVQPNEEVVVPAELNHPDFEYLRADTTKETEEKVLSSNPLVVNLANPTNFNPVSEEEQKTNEAIAKQHEDNQDTEGKNKHFHSKSEQKRVEAVKNNK